MEGVKKSMQKHFLRLLTRAALYWHGFQSRDR